MSGTTGLHVWQIVIKRMVIRWNTCNPLQLLKMCKFHTFNYDFILIQLVSNITIGRCARFCASWEVHKLVACMYVASHFEKLRTYWKYFPCVEFGTMSTLFEKNIFIQSAFISAILTHFEKISKIKFCMDRVIFFA